MGLADNAARAASNVVIPSNTPSYIATALKKAAAKTVTAKQTAVPAKAVAPIKAKATPVNKVYETPSKTTSTVKTPAPKKDLGTGSIETKTAPTTTASSSGGGSVGGALGLQETLQKQAADEAYQAAQAMRQFQREQANRQLTDALGTIDRAAIENYKGISNDYASRGLSRSGGYMNMEAMAMADKTRADQQANQSVTDFLNQLDLQGTADLKSLNTTNQQIMADFLARKFSALGG